MATTHQPGGRGGFQQGGRRDVQPPTLPVAKAFELRDAQGNPKPELLDEGAREWAQKFGSALKTSQMRRFFDEVKAIERRIDLATVEEGPAAFARERAGLALLKAKSSYAVSRDVAPPAFNQFMFDSVASIKDVQDFRAFVKVFEAIVAFHRFLNPRN